MLRCWLLLLLIGCTNENPHLVVERQPAPLAQTSDGGWIRGSVILTGEAGTFTFPQTVSLRLTIVNEPGDDMTEPKPLAIAMANVQTYAAGPLQITTAPSCAATACTAEVSMTDAGSSMLQITAHGPEGMERECFYYAVVEGASVDTAMLREQLEMQQHDCKLMVGS